MLKVCTKCKEEKPVYEFARDKYRPDGMTLHCRACKRKEDGFRYNDPTHKPHLLEKLRERSRKNRLALRAAGLCHDCGASAENKVRCVVCAKMASSRSNTERESCKQRCLDHYGRRCACCGEGTEKFLSLDHVNNDGAEHRRSIGGKNIGTIWKWLVCHKFPEGFQILCYNCNCGKSQNKGRCPHEDDRKHPIDAMLSRFPEVKTVQ